MEWLSYVLVYIAGLVTFPGIVLISNRGFRDSFRKHKRLPESVPIPGTNLMWQEVPKDYVKSEMMELLEEQTEWTKALTSHRQYRDTVRINEHAIWNNNYETAHSHFEVFERYNDVTKIPIQVRFDK